MILVTGAGGKTGRAVLQALAKQGAATRAWVHEPAPPTRIPGVDEVVAGDMRDPKMWLTALRGTHAVYVIFPNVVSDEPIMGEMAVEAAMICGVERLVYHSVLHPQTRTMPHHWQKLQVEETILQSALSWTILQPAAYMQNVLANWEAVVSDGVYPIPYGPGTRLGLVDLADIAEAAATVLIDSGHVGAIYELAGPEVLTQVDIADILARHLDRAVRAQVVSVEEWTRRAKEMGMNEYARTTLTAMFQYYDRHGFWGNPRVLEWLLGRPATSFATFLERVDPNRGTPS